MLSIFFTRTRLSKQRGKPTGVDQRGQHGGGGVATDRQARTNWPAPANPLQVASNSPSAEVGARVPVTGLDISAVGIPCPTSARTWSEVADCAVQVDVRRDSSRAWCVAVSALT